MAGVLTWRREDDVTRVFADGVLVSVILLEADLGCGGTAGILEASCFMVAGSSLIPERRETASVNAKCDCPYSSINSIKTISLMNYMYQYICVY